MIFFCLRLEHTMKYIKPNQLLHVILASLGQVSLVVRP